MLQKFERKELTIDDLEFEHSLRRGNQFFQGFPCPTNIAWDILGQEGINLIDNKLISAVSKLAIENGEYQKRGVTLPLTGFSKNEFIIDNVNKVKFHVGKTIRDLEWEKRRVQFLDNYEDITLPVYVEDFLKEHDYFNLKTIPHYIIAPWERLDGCEIYFPEKTIFE